MFIQTEATADPAIVKFLPGQPVFGQGTLAFDDAQEAAVRSPLAARLLGIAGVAAVRLGAEDIAVTKREGDWQHLKPAILGIIMEHFLSGAPVVIDVAGAAAEPGGTAAMIRDALREVIDPELGYNIVDLGLVYDVAVADGRARVTMTTTTPGCPATNYLKEGARECAGHVGGVEAAEVELTYDPRWSPEMMSPAAKAHFGIDG
jgi:metal-sulfur cluster biosynthetic enzyme